MPEDNDLMSVEDVAQGLGVSRQRVNKLIADGRLPVVRLSPRVVVVRREDFEAFEKLPRMRTGRPLGSLNKPKAKKRAVRQRRAK